MDIYAITNLVNRKVYIGKTVQSPQTRFKQHKNLAKRGTSDQLIHKAIAKYGAENFKFEVIAHASSEDELSEAEQRFIVEYDCCVLDGPDKGYNMTRGGEGTFGWKHTEEIKQKMSESRMGNKNSLGKFHSDETKQKMSTHKTGKKPNNYGKPRSESAKLKGSLSWKVVCPNGQEMTVTNMNEFCKPLGLDSGHMYKVAMGKSKQHKGYTCSRA